MQKLDTGAAFLLFIIEFFVREGREALDDLDFLRVVGVAVEAVEVVLPLCKVERSVLELLGFKE